MSRSLRQGYPDHFEYQELHGMSFPDFSMLNSSEYTVKLGAAIQTHVLLEVRGSFNLV
jgi:hypothetical protein